MHSLVLHNAEKVTLKRKRDDWTTLVVTHRANGYNAEGEYAHVTTETEIILHHHDLPTLPFKIERAS